MSAGGLRIHAEPWRYRCPEGHAAVVQRKDDRRHGAEPRSRFYCETCKENPDRDQYIDHVVDAKSGQQIRA